MTKNLIVVLAFGLSLSACSKSESNPQKTSSGMEKYELEENGCNTGEHTFTGTAESAKKQLCEALQDDALNKGCAARLRKAYFETNCEGQIWKPRLNNLETSRRETSKPDLSNPVHGSDKIERTLENVVFVDTVAIKPGLSGSDLKLAETIASDIVACGINKFGDLCGLDQRKGFNSRSVLVDDRIYYVANVNSAIGNLVIFFAIDRIEPEVVVGEIEIGLVPEFNMRDDELANFVKNKPGFRDLVRARSGEELVSLGLKKVSESKNPRELNHVIFDVKNYLMMNRKPSELKTVLPILNQAFLNNIDVITQDRSIYLKKNFELALNLKDGLSREQFRSVMKKFFDCGVPEIQVQAAKNL